jgi:preprotein translocase subunit SecD
MNGISNKLLATMAFLLLSAWYLIPTVRFQLEQRHIDSLPEVEKEMYMEENKGKMIKLKEDRLNLGLDLQGGMHVTLEVGTDRLLLELASDYSDSLLVNVVNEAAIVSNQDDTDLIDEVLRIFTERDASARLSRYYRSDAQGITRRSTNEEVAVYLKSQRDMAVQRAIEIIRTRVDRYGVTEPSILQQGNNRVIVELPGVDDEERVRNLLKGTARLEFRLAADLQELNSAKQAVFEFYNQIPVSLENDSLAVATNKLAEIMDPNSGSQYAFGISEAADTAAVNVLLSAPQVRRLMPRGTTIMWSAKPLAVTENGDKFYQMIGVRTETELTGEVIEEAAISFDPTTNIPEVSMNMNGEGARKWARITGSNIGKPIAIVLDGYVYSYPNVQNKISNGRSSITGLADVAEAEDLVNILLSGALPAPLNIIEERTVGATLGEASIKAGFYSTVIGLLIVAIFMIIYYRKAGAIADLALIINIVFILGILAAFKATLTLPGIAGIVLTIGMAVDANVLIFDRIREEQRNGRPLLSAISEGFEHAKSAIFDSNITTFLVAAILYSFGVGPIKGFAVTLMAGIASSLFCALVITRMVVDSSSSKGKSNINFG